MMNELSIRKGDHTIQGRFTYRSRACIQVEITSSFYPFRSSLTMYVPESRSAGQLLGEEGMISGGHLLRGLHRLCRFLEKNREKLLAYYREYAEQLAETEKSKGISDFYFELESEALYEELREGKIMQAEYERRLERAEHRYFLYKRLRTLLRKEFFARFPFTISQELQGQVLEWLRWESINDEASEK